MWPFVGAMGPLGIAVLVVLNVVYYFWPGLSSPSLQNWTFGFVILLVGGAAEIVGVGGDVAALLLLLLARGPASPPGARRRREADAEGEAEELHDDVGSRERGAEESRAAVTVTVPGVSGSIWSPPGRVVGV